jgi:hypothetical protein
LTVPVNEALFPQVNGPEEVAVTALETTGSGLIAALEQTWTDIRHTPQLPEVVVVTGTALSSGVLHLDAKWGHFGADHWVQGHPTEAGQGAALDLSAARRKPELFISGECLAEGPRQTLQTMLHEAVHALAYARGVNDTSRGGKYHNKREFVTLAGELGLAWPQGQRPHPVIGFSEVQLAEQTLADYADTLADLGAAIRLYRDTFRRLGLLGGQGHGEGQDGQDGDGQPPTGKTGERFKVACGCQPPRSFWIRAKQYTPGADHLRDLRPGLSPNNAGRQDQAQ